MNHHHRIFFTLLFVIILLGGALLIKQIIITNKLSTTPGKDFIISPDAYDLPLSGKEQTLGNPGSSITIILFSSFGTSKTKEIYNTIISFIHRNPNVARLIWKDVPQKTLFKNSILAHRATFCAGEQNKFWPFTDKLMLNKKINDQDELKNIAKEIKLNTNEWEKCLTEEKTERFIQDAILNSRQLGITSPPELFINNKKLNLDAKINLEQLLNSLIQ